MAISTPSWLTASIAVLLGVFTCHYLLVTAPAQRRRSALGCQVPPEIKPWFPYFGIDFLRARSKHTKSHSWLDYSRRLFIRQDGQKTFQLNILNKSLIFTIDPINLKAIHITKFKSFGIPPNRRSRVVPLIGDGVFTLDGSGWTHSRKLLRPSFEKSRVEPTFLETHIQDMLRFIRKNEVVDLQILFYRFTMNTAREFLLNDHLTADAPLVDAFEVAFDRSLRKIGGAGKFMSFTSKADDEWEKDVKLVHDTIDDRIQRAIDDQSAGRRSADKKIFIDYLVSESTDLAQIRSELLNNLMAGRDTTAATLTNTFFELSKSPRIWQQLRDEVERTLQGRVPTGPELERLPYLRAILDESIRMYPQIPENGRIALEDTVLPTGGGKDGTAPVFVPKGQTVMWNNYVLQRQPDIFSPDPNTFRPERWFEEDLKPGLGYLAFGAGPRSCMGKQFALLQASYVTVRLVQLFDKIETATDKPWTERLSLVLGIEGGCPVRLS